MNQFPPVTGAGSVTGPGSSTSGNIPTFNGTGGNTLQDSGVAIGAIAAAASAASTADGKAVAAQSTANTHASRHLPGGADALLSASAGDQVTYNGSIFAPKWAGIHQLTANSASFTASLVTYLTLTTPRAGTYEFRILALWNGADTTSGTVQAAIACTNMTRSIYDCHMDNSSVDASSTPGFNEWSIEGTTTFPGTTSSGGQNTTGRRRVIFKGLFTTSAGGVFTLQMLKSAGVAALQLGSYLRIEEV